jgi:hypothetical protein
MPYGEPGFSPALRAYLVFAKSSTANSCPSFSTTPTPIESMSESKIFARCIAELKNSATIASTRAPKQTFSESELNRTPACVARAAMPGSPGNPCCASPCSAITRACFRAAMASSSLQRSPGRPCFSRARFTDSSSFNSAAPRPLAVCACKTTEDAKATNNTNEMKIFITTLMWGQPPSAVPKLKSHSYFAGFCSCAGFSNFESSTGTFSFTSLT